MVVMILDFILWTLYLPYTKVLNFSNKLYHRIYGNYQLSIKRIVSNFRF
jgi:hypothetical protein